MNPPGPFKIPAVEASRRTWNAGTLIYAKADLAILFFWLLWGDFAWQMKERGILYTVEVLLKKFDASDLVNGLLVGAIPPIVLVFLGPVLSFHSDRQRGPMGRRIPYLLAITPVAVFGIVGLAFSPALGAWLHAQLGARSPGLNTLVIGWFVVFWTIFELASNGGFSIFNGLVNDVVPRPLLGRFFGLFRTATLLAAIVFNYFFLGYAETQYFWIFLGIALLYGGGFTSMCLKVKEGKYPPVAPDAGNPLSNIVGYCRDCFGNPYYLWFFATLSLPYVAFAPVNLFNIFFAKSIAMNLGSFGKYLALTYVISISVSYGLGCLADRLHPLRISLVAIMLYAGMTLWGGLFARTPETFAIALVGHGVFSGVWMTCVAGLPQMLLPKAKFAQFHSAIYITMNLGIMIYNPFMGLLLDHSQHNYRLTYLAASGLSVLALVSGVVLYGKFLRLGGPAHYQPPGEITEA
jgi:MFS family permease